MIEPMLANTDVQIWSTVWLVVLIAGGAVFLGVLVYSVVTGAADIADLLRSLGAEQERPPSDQREENDTSDPRA